MPRTRKAADRANSVVPLGQPVEPVLAQKASAGPAGAAIAVGVADSAVGAITADTDQHRIATNAAGTTSTGAGQRLSTGSTGSAGTQQLPAGAAGTAVSRV